MRVMSDDDAVSWCEGAGFVVDDTVSSTRVKPADAHGSRLRIGISGDATDIVGLAYVLAMTGVPDYEEDAFSGALIWLQRWEIWSESIDRVGYALVDGIRARSEVARDMDATPAQLFVGGEFIGAHTCLSLPMLFQWDAYFLPAHGHFAAFLSHEGHLDFVPRNQQVQEAILQRFERWSPREISAGTRSE